ncbi:MAG: NTP transferase domain-containing protein, partial [Bacteroidales bacterium]|nr:NTP transferase domain-containing protein [Bacteroidales bacterium]
MQKTVAIIPARYASTRFPGKPLALLGGKPVIQWVWENVSAMPELACAVVATDDERIAAAVEGFGGRAMMTASTHRSGTDRCVEVVRHLREQGQMFDVAINVQGDEPFVRQEQLRSLVDCFADGEVQIATLKTAIRSTEELFSPNNVKVVCDLRGRALYFS